MKSKKIILVTEDDGSLRGALDDKLINEGFSILEARNGEEGLKVAFGDHPDLILLDIAMPKMDGMTMLRELRKDAWGKTVPVIIMTNMPSDDENRNKDITELEPTYYFVKTDKTIGEVVDKIKERLG